MVDIDMLEGVFGVLAFLSPVEYQSHQIFVTAYDLTGVHTTHTLNTRSTTFIM